MSLLDRLAKRAATPPAATPRAPVRRAAPPTQASPPPDYEAERQAMQAELEVHRAAVESEKNRATRAERQAKDLLTKAEASDRAARSVQLRAATARIAHRLHAHDPEELADLLERKLTLGPDGAAVDATDVTRTAEDVIKAYIETRPWHVPSTVASGSGAAPPRGKVPVPPGAKNNDMRTQEGQQNALAEAVASLAAAAHKPS